MQCKQDMIEAGACIIPNSCYRCGLGPCLRTPMAASDRVTIDCGSIMLSTAEESLFDLAARLYVAPATAKPDEIRRLARYVIANAAD